MKELKFDLNIGSEEIISLQEFYLSQGEFNVDEKYFSPDGNYGLRLDFNYEIRGGPAVYNSKLLTSTKIISIRRTINNIIFESKSYASLGQYGIGYDYWSGNPWSNGSKYVSMVELDTKQLSSTLSMIDTETMKAKTVIKRKGYLVHHMWSDNDCYYMFRDINTWYIYDMSKNSNSVICRCNQFPKHCYFTNNNNIMLLDDCMNVNIINPETLTILGYQSLKNAINAEESID